MFSIASILSFRIFDPHNTGTIDEEQFRKIMKSKQGIPEEDVEEMIDGNKQIINYKSSHFQIQQTR